MIFFQRHLNPHTLHILVTYTALTCNRSSHCQQILQNKFYAQDYFFGCLDFFSRCIACNYVSFSCYNFTKMKALLDADKRKYSARQIAILALLFSPSWKLIGAGFWIITRMWHFNLQLLNWPSTILVKSQSADEDVLENDYNVDNGMFVFVYLC